MIYYILIAAIVLVAFYFVFIKSRKKNEEQSEPQDAPDFEKDFFARSEAGEKAQLFMTLASNSDCSVIRSLLYADGIPSYVEGEHMNNIYGGITGTMSTVVAIKLYIMCKDYSRAVEIIDTSGIKKGNIILQPQEYGQN